MVQQLQLLDRVTEFTLKYLRILFVTVAMMIALFIVILNKFVRVYVHLVPNERLGHLASNTELSYLRAIQVHAKSNKFMVNILCIPSAPSANKYFENMWRRQFPTIRGKLGMPVYSALSKFGYANLLPSNDIDIDGLLLKSLPSLKFRSDEIESGIRFLKSFGLTENSPFVCLHVRDAAYLQAGDAFSHTDYSYHSYRNSAIETYVNAAEVIADLGYTVFRMGSVVEKPIPTSHPRIIDYATNGMRTEFLDIFLGAHCAFCISTASGWDSIPMVFRRPIMYVNYLPVFTRGAIYSNSVLYPKSLIDISTGRILTLNEIITKKVQEAYRTQLFNDAGLIWHDLTPDELVSAFREMVERVNGQFIPIPSAQETQEKILNIFRTHPDLSPPTGHYPPYADFASCFLTSNPYWAD